MYSGKVGLENLNGEEVALGDDTQYRAFTEAEELQRTITYYDFNADGTPDTVVHGTVKDVIQTDGSTVNRFVAENTPQLWTTADTVDWQGVYFRAEDAATQAPDLLRRADTQKRLDQSIGLLTQISQEDYRNTDILIFRESTGQLILHRRGLSDAEIQGRPQTGFDETDNRFAYRVMLRGPRDSDLNIGGGNRSGGYSQFASTLKMAAPFQHREADHPKPGETVRVVAINRATGYIGTARTPLTSAAGNAMASVEVPEITMRPPNLKIWAERISTVEQGMTQGEERHHVIGSEGAGLTSDTTITLYTEWLDSDGSALPTELGLDGGEQFGLTGRLAKIVAPNTLAATAIGSSSLAEFPIAPGRRTQALQIGSNLSQAEHFYIHVVGTPKDADPPPNFAIGDAVAPYDSRPRRFTPFLVPLFDEASTMADYNAYRQLQARDTPPEDLQNPPPTYVWQFRPEYQFSQFDLDMRALERVTGLGTPQEERTDILNTQTPVIASSDDLIQALYSLIGNQFDRLTPIDGKQELLLALGETETLVELGQDKTLRFSNLQSLASLNPEDFLTMRLYTNNDAGNVLWEWAFELLAIYSPEDIDEKQFEDTIFLSADEPVLPISALLVGYASRDPASLSPVTLQWSVEGAGTVSPVVETNSTDGQFSTTLTMPHASNSEGMVVARLNDTKATFTKVRIVPGKPASISLQSSGTAYVQGFGAANVMATIRDAYGNLVNDGTSVTFRTLGSGFVQTFDGFTTNGVATAIVKGGYSSGVGTLEVAVGELVTTAPYTIGSIDLAFVGVPNSAPPATFLDVTLNATAGGVPVSNIFVDVGMAGGNITLTQQRTDANGELHFTIDTGYSDIPLKLTARADINNQAVASITKTAEPIHMSRSFLVSDRSGAGSGSYTGFNGATTSVNFPGTQEISIQGPPNTTWSAALNDPFYPNHEPLLNFQFSNVNKDETGLHDATSTNVFRSDLIAPEAKRSVYFAGSDSQLNIQDTAELAATHPSAVAWIRVKSSGSILDWGEGAFRLSAQSDNTLQLNVMTSNGLKSVSSAPVARDSWLRVVAGVNSSGMFLQVDDQKYALPLSSETVSISSPAGIQVGGGFAGSMGHFRVYDLDSPDLVSISSFAGTYNNAGEASILVQSNNTFGLAQAGSRLANTTVGLRIGGTQTLPVNIIQAPMYTRYIGMIADTFADSGVDADEVAEKAITPGPMAQNSDIPKKILDIASDTDVGKPVNVVKAALGYTMFRDDLAALTPHVATIQRFYHDAGQPQMALATADLLGEAVKMAAEGNSSLLRILQTSLAVMAETIESSSEAAHVIAQSVESRSDFWVWMRFMSMPGKGWIGPVIPIPKPDSNCFTLTPDVNVGTPLEFASTPCRVSGAVVAYIINDWISSDAAIAANPRLMTAEIRVLNNAMASAPYEVNKLMFTVQTNQGLVNNGVLGTETANAIFPAIFRGGFTVIKVALGIIKKHGANHFINFLQDRTTSRYDALEFMMAIGYLGTRSANGGCNEHCLDGAVQKSVEANFAKWLLGLSLSKNAEYLEPSREKQLCQLGFQAHGAAHELVLTALYSAVNEFGGSLGTKYRVLAADKAVPLALLESDGNDLDDEPDRFGKYDRRPDLILEGDGPKHRIWIEAKSNRKVSTHGFKPWSLTSKSRFKDRSSYHRQFFYDRVASGTALNAHYWDTEDLNPYAEFKPADIIWQFQMWEPASRVYRKTSKRNSKHFREIPINRATPWMTASEVKANSAVNADFKKMQEFFVQLPTGGKHDEIAKINLGYVNPGTENAAYAEQQVGHRRQLVPFTIVGELKRIGGDALKDQVISKLTEDFIDPRYKQLLDGEISDEAKAAMREQIENKIEEYLGPLKQVLDAADAITPEEIKKLEEQVTEWADGMIGDKLVEEIGSIEFSPEGWSCDRDE